MMEQIYLPDVYIYDLVKFEPIKFTKKSESLYLSNAGKLE